MKSKFKRKQFNIKVNDIFDELSDENNRLNNELMFANNCLNVLNKIKVLLNKFCLKYETIIDSEDKQELNQLKDEFNSVIRGEEQIEVTIDVNISENNGKVTQEWEELSEEKTSIITSPSNETNLRRSGRTDRKLYAIPVKRNTRPKTTEKPKPVPKVISIPEPEEEPNSMLLMRRNNFNPQTQRYVCPNPSCVKSFPTHRYLYAHFRMSHNMKKRYFCDHQNCNKRFKTREALRSHSITHSDIRPFMCSVKGCNQRFKRSKDLDAHQVIHSDIRPYKCSECHKSYKLEAFLKRHELNHKRMLSFRCHYEDCHQVFQTEWLLVKHKRVVHNIEKKIKRCDWPGCDYQTRRWDLFGIHKTLHTGAKPYQCVWPACGKWFRTRQYLSTHMLVHKNLKPFACVWPGCQHRCRTSGNLKLHLRVHQK